MKKILCLIIFALLIPVFLSASDAFAHLSLSNNHSHFYELNHFLDGSIDLTGLATLGVITVAALVHLKLSKKRV